MFRSRKMRWFAPLALALVLGGAWYWFRGQNRASAQYQATSTLQTTRARLGELVISATGAGTVISANQISLAFSTGGELTEVKAQVGGQVKSGAVLARIDDLSARLAQSSAQLQLAKAQSDLDTARQNHLELLAGASEPDLLSAQAAVKTAEEKLADLKAGASEADLANAEASLASAQDDYARLVSGPDAEELVRAQLSLDRAKNSLWASQNARDDACSRGGSSGCDGAKASVLNAEIAVQQAQMDLADLKKPATATALKNAKAKLDQAQATLNTLRTGASAAERASAEAQLAQAKEILARLRSQPLAKDISASESQVRQAELTLEQAERALEAAQNDLEDTVLIAPFDGTILSVAARVSERIGSSAMVALADMSTPTLEIYVDESDMDKIAAGYAVDVKLDAMPDETFTGHVTRVDPELVNVSNSNVVRALVTLDAGSFAKSQQLLLGLNASVDVIGGRAENAVLVPIEALHEIDPGTFAVFVVEDGQPKLRMVEVGLQDLTYAEIRSGLRVGETVSTGLVEIK